MAKPQQGQRKRMSARKAAQARARRRERNRILRWVAAAVAVAAVVAAFAVARGGGSTSKSATTSQTDIASAAVTGPPGPEGIPLQQGGLLAPASPAATGDPVDGIQCQTNEQVVYHIHTHLAVFVNGALRPIPPGIGIVQPVATQTANGPLYGASTCYYWLHVHAQDGVIHVESPSVKNYTLGQFFAIWNQPLSSNAVGPASGPTTVFVDGRRYSGDPASITLASHRDIQVDVGSPTVPPQKVIWAGTGL